jgi:hypothetical protein
MTEDAEVPPAPTVYVHGATPDAGAVALGGTILRGLVGSTVHGTAIEGQDDRDEMGVFIEPPKNVCGLTPCEHYIQRDRPEGVRSEAGDLDLTLYSLRRYCGLAVRGSPSIYMLLWLPEYTERHRLGDMLIAIREAFLSEGMGRRYLGYLASQRKQLEADAARGFRRPELVASYGYDTKAAMHALRLGFQGIELFTQRRLTLPVAEPELTTLRAVRSGAVPCVEAVAMIGAAEARLRTLVDACDWRADIGCIDRFMVDAHFAWWRGDR